jgi:hypothetical protein
MWPAGDWKAANRDAELPEAKAAQEHSETVG